MIKQIAWNTFKKTGNINTFVELKEIDKIQKNLTIKEENYGDYKNQGNNNSRT